MRDPDGATSLWRTKMGAANQVVADLEAEVRRWKKDASKKQQIIERLMNKVAEMEKILNDGKRREFDNY